MSIHRDKAAGCWRFEFDRVIPGRGRVRARKRLPKAWSRAQADAFDREESARLYAIATGVERPAHLIDDAVILYLRERVPELKSGRRIAQELALIAEHYQGRPLTALPDACSAITARGLTEGWAPATTRNRIRYLTSAARWGWRRHAMCEHDPAARVIVPAVDNERQVYADRVDVLRVMRIIGKLPPPSRRRGDIVPHEQKRRDTRDLVRVLYYSGMRVGEALRAVVTEAGYELADTKNGRPRTVPIHPRAAAAARRLPGLKTQRSEMEKLWRRARDAAGLPDLWMHSLRHSTASALINAGVDLTTIGAILGHSSAQSTRRYSHLATGTLSAALAKIGKKAA